MAGNLPVANLGGGAGASATAYWAGNGTWATPLQVGVATFSAGTTGFTPNTATNGAVTLAGTLNTANGGLGANMTATAIGAIPYSTSTTTYGTLADVLPTGSFLTSGGAGVAHHGPRQHNCRWF